MFYSRRDRARNKELKKYPGQANLSWLHWFWYSWFHCWKLAHDMSASLSGNSEDFCISNLEKNKHIDCWWICSTYPFLFFKDSERQAFCLLCCQ
jgi:hypothetical protein